VRARVERFIEPALLLLLKSGRAHGYEIQERLGAAGDTGLDLGNLYRILRGLEEEGVVTSTWREDLPGPLRRSYELTEAGGRLLARWAEALRENQEVISSFLRRYDETEQAEGTLTKEEVTCA
jgi:poly-beta-hydroxybutyrate-responsive repressor